MSKHIIFHTQGVIKTSLHMCVGHLPEKVANKGVNSFYFIRTTPGMVPLCRDLDEAEQKV